jgi:hypothetical protein
MREDLLGYVLEALDDNEHEELQNELKKDPRLQCDLERLRARLEPLIDERLPLDPPPGLASRVCDRLKREIERGQITPASRVPEANQAVSRGGFTFTDAVVAAGVMLAAAFIFFPAIAQSRYQSQLAVCQNNLRQLGTSLKEFSQAGGGEFPFVPAEGKLAAAGLYAPVLAEEGWLDDPRVVLCPGSDLADAADEFTVPTRDDLREAVEVELASMRRRMGGSYAYTLGHLADGKLHPTRDRSRSHFVLMADAPSSTGGRQNSPNHGMYGQNVLYEDGRVKYLQRCLEQMTGDEFFVNDRGWVEAGLHAEDAVVAGSAVSPLKQ